MIKKLTKLESEFAGKLLYSLKYRIIERRQQVLSTCLAYLEDPLFLESTQGKYLSYASRDEIAETLERLLVRLFPDTPDPPVDNVDLNDDPDEPEVIYEPEEIDEAPPPKRARSNESDDLEEFVNKKPEPQPAKGKSPLEIIESAMSEYETSGERPSSLEKVNSVARCNIVTPILIFNIISDLPSSFIRAPN